MSSGKQHRALLRICGIVAIALGVVGGIGLWVAAQQRLDDAVAGLARAPVGCDTMLDFDATGTYLLFVETAGELGDVRGDCDVDPDVDWDGDELPSVELTLIGPDGDDLDLESDDGVSYDAGGSAGQSIETIDIETPGDHVLRVESDDSGFAISVGRNPNDSVLVLRAGAVGAALVGIVLGVTLLLRSRRRVDQSAPADVWAPQPSGGPDWPISPPGFPVPPPTTGTSAVVGPPSGPGIRPGGGALPTPPSPGAGTAPGRGTSVAPIPGQPGPWGPPAPPADRRPGT